MTAPDSKRKYDLNGWYEVQDNPISRAGVFPYLGASIGAPEPGRVYQVYRPAEELSDPETIASFRLVPWTNDHAMLGNPAMDASLKKPEDKGIHGVIGEQTYYRDGVLYGNLKLFSTSLDATIDDGKKELSCGFRCVYDFKSGSFEGKPYEVIQRCIRGNHIASVREGRMGPQFAVMDRADNFTFTFDAKDLEPMTTKTPAEIAALRTSTRDALFSKLGLTDRAAFDAAMDAADKAMDEFPPKKDDTAAGGAPPKPGAGTDPTPKTEMTMTEALQVLQQLAPIVAKIQETATVMAGGDPPADDAGMEQVTDEQGQPVIDPATGQPKMQKKAAAVNSGMDAVTLKSARETLAAKLTGDTRTAALAAMDEQIAAAEKTAPPAVITVDRMKAVEDGVADLRNTASFKTFVAELAQRNALAARLSHFVGTFDHSEMSLGEVAKYGVEKLGLKPAAGTEVTAVESYLHDRKAPSQETRLFALDGADKGDGKGKTVDGYLTGADRKTA